MTQIKEDSLLNEVAVALGTAITTGTDAEKLLDNQRLIFSIFVQAVLDGSIPETIRTGQFKPGFDPVYVKAKIQSLINSLAGHRPSLFALHLRSQCIHDGRLSVIGTNKPPEMEYVKREKYHSRLLKTYFSVFDRINTFNDRLFEIFLSSIGEVGIYTIRFSGQEYPELVLKTQEERILVIPNELASHLIEEKDMKSFLFPDESKNENINRWDSQLRAISLLEELKRKREKTWFREIAKERSFSKWKPVLQFLDFQNQREDWETVSEWDTITRIHLKYSLRFLQGILLYRHFAYDSITTIITRFPRSDAAFGITLGDDKNELTNFLAELRKTIKSFSSDIINPHLLAHKSQHVAKTLPEEMFGKKVWVSAIRDYNKETIDLLTKCSCYLKKIEKLRFAVHEGEDLVFTLYIGRQTILTRFKELQPLTSNEVEAFGIEKSNLTQNFSNALKSHYSLFRDGLTGLFIDYIDPSQMMIVRPLKILPKLLKDNNPFLDDDIIRSQEHTNLIFEALTDSVKYLAVLQVRSGRMSLFYDGEYLLAWPDKEDYRWWSPRSQKDSWTSKSDFVLLFTKIFNEFSGGQIQSAAKSLTEAILSCSAMPQKGAMIVIEKPENGLSVIQGMKSKLNPQKLSIWQERKIFECSAEELIDLIIPDGATLVDAKSGTIENQIQVIPITEEGTAVDLSSIKGVSGTRHATAQALTQVNKGVLVICISADGPISMFWNNKKIRPNQMDEIIL